MARVGQRFRDALDYAATLHEDQRRKHEENDPIGIPYISHLLGAASLVLEVDGSEDEAIAALLHDAIEDQPCDGLTQKKIGERYGAQVLEIVNQMDLVGQFGAGTHKRTDITEHPA